MVQCVRVCECARHAVHDATTTYAAAAPGRPASGSYRLGAAPDRTRAIVTGRVRVSCPPPPPPVRAFFFHRSSEAGFRIAIRPISRTDSLSFSPVSRPEARGGPGKRRHVPKFTINCKWKARVLSRNPSIWLVTVEISYRTPHSSELQSERWS